MTSGGQMERAPSKMKRSLDHPEVTQRLLISGAEQISQRLRTLSAAIGPSSLSTQFYTRVRAKSLESIREKIYRKRHEPDQRWRDPNYSFRKITDAVGFRIVTLYDQELITAIDYILDLVRAGQQLPEPLFERMFVWNIFREAKFIKRSSSENDPYANCLRHISSLVEIDCDNSASEAFEIKENIIRKCLPEIRSDNRYSSGHVIFNALAHIEGYVIEIPVEFQVRTAVEDIWAEINHKFLYKTNTFSVWSSDYQEAYNNSRAVSKELKKAIDQLPRVIGKFYRYSEEANSSVRKFWEKSTKDYQFSLVISLFFLIGDRYGEVFAVNFQRYKDNIDRLKEAQKREDKVSSRELILNSVKILMEAKYRAIEGRATEMQKNAPHKATKIKIDDERVGLLDLEIMRLKVFLIIYFNCWISDTYQICPLENDDQFLQDQLKLQKQRFLMDLYSQFCEYLNRPLSLRPVCMIMFFKYLIATGIDSPLGSSLAKKT